MENLLKEMENNPDATYYPKGTLCIVNDNVDNSGPVFHLAYKFDIYAISPLSRKYLYIDANTGEVLHEISRITNADQTGSASTRYSGLQTIMTTNYYFPLLWNYYTLKETGRGGGIETFNLKHDSVYGNAVACKDDNNLWVIFDPAEDQIATDAHWGTEMTYDYFKNVHARNSYNNAGAKLNSYVHFKANYNNAFWNGDVMTYGDGNGVRFTPLTCMDVVAHEITHAVTEFSANLVYQAESGALNEGFSDIFGVALKNMLKETIG